MTDIEQKALAMVNEVFVENGGSPVDYYALQGDIVATALCRAIEQHEAFRQEVSDAVEANWRGSNFGPPEYLARFIIPKPVDPLVEVVDAAIRKWTEANVPVVDGIRAELDRLGYEIREKAGDD